MEQPHFILNMRTKNVSWIIPHFNFSLESARQRPCDFFVRISSSVYLSPSFSFSRSFILWLSVVALCSPLTVACACCIAPNAKANTYQFKQWKFNKQFCYFKCDHQRNVWERKRNKQRNYDANALFCLTFDGGKRRGEVCVRVKNERHGIHMLVHVLADFRVKSVCGIVLKTSLTINENIPPIGIA